MSGDHAVLERVEAALLADLNDEMGPALDAVLLRLDPAHTIADWLRDAS